MDLTLSRRWWGERSEPSGRLLRRVVRSARSAHQSEASARANHRLPFLTQYTRIRCEGSVSTMTSTR